MSTLARATIKSYDVSTHSAAVQIIGSLAVWLDAVPVSVGIAPADVVAGRECGVIFFTDDNPSDAAVITIHNAVPTGWGGSPHRVRDADNNTYVEVENTANEDKVRMGVGGTLRYLLDTVSPHHTLTGDVKVTGNAAIGTSSPSAGTILHLKSTALGTDGYFGLVIDVGGTTTGDPGGGGTLYALTGKAITADLTTASAIAGLQYLAGVSSNPGSDYTYASVYGVELGLTSSNASGANHVIWTASSFLRCFFSTLNAKSIVTHTSIDLPGSSKTSFGTFYHIKGGSVSGAGVVYVPFEFAGPARTTDTDGSAHRNNVQFGSTTRKFGGGDGVIGLTYATTNPTANPANGVIIYADGNTGDFKVRGVGGQICKLPTGGAVNVTGARGGNVALANLLTVLAGLGLIVDGTTA